MSLPIYQFMQKEAPGETDLERFSRLFQAWSPAGGTSNASMLAFLVAQPHSDVVDGILQSDHYYQLLRGLTDGDVHLVAVREKLAEPEGDDGRGDYFEGENAKEWTLLKPGARMPKGPRLIFLSQDASGLSLGDVIALDPNNSKVAFREVRRYLLGAKHFLATASVSADRQRQIDFHVAMRKGEGIFNRDVLLRQFNYFSQFRPLKAAQGNESFFWDFIEWIF